MNKIEKVFTAVVVIMLITIFTLLHNIEGVNLTAAYLLLLPMVVIRFVRAILLIRTKG